MAALVGAALVWILVDSGQQRFDHEIALEPTSRPTTYEQAEKKALQTEASSTEAVSGETRTDRPKARTATRLKQSNSPAITASGSPQQAPSTSPAGSQTGSGEYRQTPDSVRLCDQLAASPDDPSAKGQKGVTFAQMQDAERAVSACTQAATRHPDHPRYRFQLGRAHYRLGAYLQALKAYQQAARQGHLLAGHNLAVMLLKGQGIQAHSEQAIAWFRYAANQGSAEAQYTLGLFHTQGNHLPRNDRMAFQWYHKAARQGHSQAQFELGRHYYYGKGVAKNPTLGAQWVGAAAKQGLPRAQYSYGLLYENGTGVPKDRTKARHWFQKAWHNGLEIAGEKLKEKSRASD